MAKVKLADYVIDFYSNLGVDKIFQYMVQLMEI